ncbi:MAG: glycosyltransferase family 39 protein [Candidatus Limnocylindria bacterium]
MSDRAVAVALAGLVLVARVPFASQTLWAWDSVLYARALEQGFHVGGDLVDQRPHPPGYVFYVAAAAAVRVLTRDSNAALVVVSVVASALTAAAVYLVCRRYADRALAVVVALGAASAPLVWTYGEVAMPYALLGLLGVVLAVSLRDARTRSWPAALVASAGLGLAAGFRQDLLLLLGPLWLWMLVARSWRERGLCVAALGIAALAWFAPTASLSGGPAVYLATLSGQAARVSELSPAAGHDALLRNTLLTVYALWWGLLGFALLLVAAIVASLRARPRLSDEAIFFALWLLPAALVYVTIHIGDPGYLMSMLPGLYVACAALLAPIARRAPRAILTFTALLVALNVGVFVSADTPFSARAIARHDRSLESRLAFVRGSFAPASAVILAQSEYLTARYYLREYRVLFYGAEPEVLSRAVQEVRITEPTTVVVFGGLAAGLPAALRTSGDGALVTSGSVEGGSAIVAHDLEPR